MDANTITQPIASNGDSGLETAPRAEACGIEPASTQASAPAAPKTTAGQIVLIGLGVMVFLYFARPVVLPVFLACVAAMTLKPLVRLLSFCQIPLAISAAVLLGLLVAAIGIGFFKLGGPALTWMNEAPQQMSCGNGF
jgi:predicted PurR-regulated permease PerM